MKNNHILLLSFFIFLLGCNEPKKKEKIIKKTREVSTNKCLPHLRDDPKLEKEEIIIYADNDGDSLIISKNEMNKIEALFPVFKADFPSNPNESYAGNSWKKYINQDGKEDSFTFGSEAGQDYFCLVYTYYRKQKNGDEKFKKERETLIELYRAVNGLYQGLNYGGTYFGHQHKRLNADAEYSIYQLVIGKEYYEKKYDFQKQKDLYIKTVIQYVADEESQNVYYQEDLMNDKKRANERVKQLQDKINSLQKLITNYFYLNQVQNFEITYYK
jgi:hypothetical protein